MTNILLTQDYFFWSKVDGTAKALGVSACHAQSFADAEPLLADAIRVLIDLRHPDALALIHLCAEREIETIGFVSHTDADTIAAAREAGCGAVMPKSQFSQNLADILK